MSPLKRKKLIKIRYQLDKLDNSLIRIIKKRTNLVKKVLTLKEKRSQIVDKNRIKIILKNITIIFKHKLEIRKVKNFQIKNIMTLGNG